MFLLLVLDWKYFSSSLHLTGLNHLAMTQVPTGPLNLTHFSYLSLRRFALRVSTVLSTSQKAGTRCWVSSAALNSWERAQVSCPLGIHLRNLKVKSGLSAFQVVTDMSHQVTDKKYSEGVTRKREQKRCLLRTLQLNNLMWCKEEKFPGGLVHRDWEQGFDGSFPNLLTHKHVIFTNGGNNKNVQNVKLDWQLNTWITPKSM